jgi:hypothetical protein
MLFGLAAIAPLATGDMSDPIVEDAAEEIAATSPAPPPIAIPVTMAPTASSMLPLLLAVTVGAYWWYSQKHKSHGLSN